MAFAPATICKLDEERRLVGGFASVVMDAGGPVLDHQNDIIDPQDLEDAEVQFMKDFRETNLMHGPMATGPVVESVVISPEKMEAMGFPADVAKAAPTAWWIMVETDPETFAKVKAGELTMFSIEGTADRVPV